MFAHPIDTLPSYEIAVADTAVSPVSKGYGDARVSLVTRPTVGTGSDWRLTKVDGVDDLCFVRRGSGDWKGVVTVCNGHVALLGELQKPSLTATAKPGTPSIIETGFYTFFSTVKSSALSAVSISAQRSASFVLLAIGLVLAMKSGSMFLHGTRNTVQRSR